ncbi:MAG TPA: hypothetical protein VF216_03035 [Mizugakiibacter sp.]
MAPELFDGTYDNEALQRRERWRGGRLVACCLRENLPSALPQMHGPWGHYPDLPANAPAHPDHTDPLAPARLPDAA